MALATGRAYPQDFEVWDDPEVRRVRRLIDVQLDSEIEASYPSLNGCRLSITMKNGDQRDVYLPNMKGEPEFRMTTMDMREKFAELTRDIMPQEIANEIYERCGSLEDEPDILGIMDLARAKEPVVAAK